MKSTRRSFIKALTFGILGGEFLLNFPARALRKVKEEDGMEIQNGLRIFDSEIQKSMEALADTLVPGVKDIGIKSIFMDYISGNPGLAGFFDAGLWNLNGISEAKFKKPFYKIEEKEIKKEIVEHISGHNRLFLSKFRETIIKLYYSNPAAWKRLSYNGPPQPKGFMDYYLPPTKRS